MYPPAAIRGPLWLFALLSILLTSACQQKNSPPSAEASLITISGSLVYPQRIALPREAVATIRLQDVSRADGPAKIIAMEFIELRGQQVPISFAVRAPRSSFQSGHRYSIAARIENGDGKLLWITDSHNAVEPTQERIDLGDVKLVQAGKEEKPQ